MARILFLGAAPSQLPPIEYARQAGDYVITCDYLPDNPGHRLADESYDVSTTDKEGVLALARGLDIDGIVAYASDPAAPTAAYVAEALGLPGNPYESVLLLARKDKFRRFLNERGFNAPLSQSFYAREEARQWLEKLRLPVYVKPVDSSGNKGITVLHDRRDLNAAFDYALSFSREKKVVVEERIEKVGYQIDSDAFMVDGELAFWLWADAHFDPACDPPLPIANSYPSVMADEIGRRASAELQKILNLLGMNNGAFNVEFLVDAQGEVWFLEIGPRNGGDMIPDAIRHATGVDLIKATVDLAVGRSCDSVVRREPNGCWSTYVIHALDTGSFESIWVADELKPMIVEMHVRAAPGDPVCHARGSNDTVGNMILRFPDHATMLKMLGDMNRYLRVRVSPPPPVSGMLQEMSGALTEGRIV